MNVKELIESVIRGCDPESLLEGRAPFNMKKGAKVEVIDFDEDGTTTDVGEGILTTDPKFEAEYDASTAFVETKKKIGVIRPGNHYMAYDDEDVGGWYPLETRN